MECGAVKIGIQLPMLQRSLLSLSSWSKSKTLITIYWSI